MILDQSIRNNKRDGITGYMIFDDRIFAQILEGAPADIARAYERIAADPRHVNLVTLSDETVRDRAFPNWAMGATLWLADFSAMLGQAGLSNLDPAKIGAAGVLKLALALHDREQSRKAVPLARTARPAGAPQAG